MFKKDVLLNCFLFFLTFFIIENFSMLSYLKAEENVSFAMLPQISNEKAMKKWKPILKYLEEKAGVKINQIFPKDFENHVTMCKEGKIDFAYSNPITYIQAAVKGAERPKGHLALAAASSSKGFYGLFIARKDNESIKKLQDIKGKKGWITGWQSAGGYIFQQAFAIDNGIDMTKDCVLKEAPGNKQEVVISSVFNKTADFGCVRNGMLEQVEKQIDVSQIAVIAETPKYVEWIFSYDSNVKPEILSKIKEAIISIPEKILTEADLPGKPTAFNSLTDKDTDIIREVANKIKLTY
ncbi:MAG: phosphate/phosphite/phosphonate ABC transporter substrate-binding protein [Desulfobacterales bacterium]|nr:phosphate/phosphite/phosphonate ABC transporter substrate-binding protein [Desulfobacterales bacterium]